MSLLAELIAKAAKAAFDLGKRVIGVQLQEREIEKEFEGGSSANRHKADDAEWAAKQGRDRP